MELKAFIHIFVLHKRLFLTIVIGALCVGALYYFTQPERYQVSLTVNVARTYSPDTPEENYSSFYRLQADERFADTIVRWLQSPRIVADILKDAGEHLSDVPAKDLHGIFNARRLSSQVVDVQFFTTSKEQGTKRSEALEKNLNTITKQLNDTQRERSWFRVISEEPVIFSAHKSLFDVTLLSLFIGFFIAFISVVFYHYYFTSDNKD